VGYKRRVMDEATVKHVATLARLRLTEQEAARFTRELSAIADYIEQLARADVSGVAALIHPVTQRNPWREDAAESGLTREQAVANAPAHEQGFFRVPLVLE
jgi:aspartyl-tRNA(Asn)/glutamyl-tRNA(Gln) amidotransferase subunit C